MDNECTKANTLYNIKASSFLFELEPERLSFVFHCPHNSFVVCRLESPEYGQKGTNSPRGWIAGNKGSDGSR